MRNCKVEGCEKLEKTKGYCGAHYKKMRKYGDPLFFIRQMNVVKEVLPKVKKKPVKKDNRYTSYRTMLARCFYVLNKNYEHYNKRKISVCDEWKDKLEGFHNFCKDMGERPSLKYSLDRIDNDLGYFKENCRWATVHQQQANKSNNNKFVGVHLTKRGNYRAQLTVNNVRHEKYFISIDDAISYRKALELQYL
jgi:hypothetical protein